MSVEQVCMRIEVLRHTSVVTPPLRRAFSHNVHGFSCALAPLVRVRQRPCLVCVGMCVCAWLKVQVRASLCVYGPLLPDWVPISAISGVPHQHLSLWGAGATEPGRLPHPNSQPLVPATCTKPQPLRPNADAPLPAAVNGAGWESQVWILCVPGV